jgi:hypothetical protein
VNPHGRAAVPPLEAISENGGLRVRVRHQRCRTF